MSNNPIPSQSEEDLLINSENLDKAINSTQSTWNDRFGNPRPTLKSLENEYEVEVNKAEIAANKAETAADRAEDAVQFKYKVSVVNDLDGVSPVPEEGDWAYVDENSHLYQYLTGDWVDKGESPSARKVDKDALTDILFEMNVEEEDKVVGGILGKDDKAVFQVRASGKIDNKDFNELREGINEVLPLSEKITNISKDDLDKVVGGILGSGDKAVFQVRSSGKIDNKHIDRIDRDILALQSGIGNEAYSNIKAIVNFLIFLVYGQSLSIGALGTPPRSTTPLSWARRFVGGLISRNGAVPDRYASLVDLNETTQETIVSGMLLMIKQLLLEENGVDITEAGYLPFASCPGEGGRSASELQEGSTYFTRLKADVTQANLLAIQDGKVAQVLAMPYLQGEQDYTIDSPADFWKTKVRGIRQSAENHARLTTGINQPLPMILYQLTQHIAKGREPTLALAATELCEDPYIGFATPLYFIPSVDISHRDANGYYWIGSYFGLAIKRWVFDGIKPIPMSPRDVVWTDNMVSLRFPTAVGKIVFDTIMVVDPGNYGFRLYQDDGITPVEISSVSIAGDRVIISAAIPNNARLRYGWEGGIDDDPDSPREGPVNGARGCLRDSRGDTIVADRTGSAFPLHQFCPIFEELRP